MPNLDLTLKVRVNGQALPNFPLLRRLEGVTAAVGPMTEQLAASGNIDLFAIGILQMLFVQPKGVLALGMNGGNASAASAVKLNPGGCMLVFNTSIVEATSNPYVCPVVPTEIVTVAAGSSPTLI